MKVHNKITIIYVAIVVIVFVGIYYFLSINLQQQAFKRISQNLQKQLFVSRLYLESYLNDLQADLQRSFDDFADNLSEELGLRVTLIDKDGVVLGDSELEGDQINNVENHLYRSEVQQALKSGFGESMRFSTTVRKNFLYMATMYSSGPLKGFIRLSMPLSEIDDISRSLGRTILFWLLLAFILFLFASYLGSLIISRPIKQISAAAKSIAEGDFLNKAYIDSNDEIEELANTLNYMTEQIKLRMEEASVEKSKLQAVLMSMIEGVMVLDESGKIILMNKTLQDLLNISEDPYGKYSLEIIRNIDIHNLIKESMEIKDGILTKEVSIFMPEEKIFLVHGTQIVRNFSPQGMVLVFHDITDLRRLEEMRRDFVANVSHELRTPLTSIKGYAETLLLGGIDDKDNAKDFIKIIYSDSERLAFLIEDLLDLSKIESGVVPLNVKPVDIKTLFDEVLKLLNKQIKNKFLEVELDIPDAIPNVLIDPEKISQVFYNLLNNAIKYNKDEGQIMIIAQREDSSLKVAIKDTGIGIPEKDLPRIFERFYRADKARSKELGGTGLGLSIVKHILQLHKCNISVESILDAGTTFTFNLPLA